MTSNMNEVRPEPGPMHQCAEALLRTLDSLNPVLRGVAPDMFLMGATGHLHEYVIMDNDRKYVIITQCAACGKMWMEWEEDNDQ